MKKVFLVLSIICCYFMNIGHVFATDLTVANDGFESVGTNEVHVIYSKVDFEAALANGDIEFNGDFDIKKITQPSKTDMSDGTYDEKRNESNDYLTYSSFADGSPVLVYTESVTVGEHQLPGSVTMRFRDAVIFSDHTYGDLVITLDNITVKKTKKSTTRPIALLLSVNGKLWFGGYQAEQERSAAEISDKVSAGTIGLAYDVNFNVTKPGSNESVNKKMILSFIDIDIMDSINSLDSDEIYGYVDANGNPLPFAESITLISGANEIIHVKNDYETYILVSDTSYGKNTKFSGKKSVDATDSNNPAGFITRVNSGEFKLRWSGVACATKLGVISTANIETSKTGEYPDKVNITPSDDTILWKENKIIEMNAESGYYIDEIIIDDVKIPYSSLSKDSSGKIVFEKDNKVYNFEEEDGIVKYIFENITEDHIISVSAKGYNSDSLEYEEISVNPDSGIFLPTLFITLITLLSVLSINIYKKNIFKNNNNK